MSNKNIPNLIPLDKMKIIMKEAMNEADTWEDFYVGLLEKVYWFGYDEGMKDIPN